MYTLGMKRLYSRPCEKCGKQVEGIQRPDRKAFYYPKRCVDCNGYKHRKQYTPKKGRGGYLRITTPTGRQLQHRVVWTEVNGAIPDGYHIHHLNHVRDDNRLENLCLISHSDHSRLHGKASKTNGRWARNHDLCIECSKAELPHWAKGLCRRCYLRGKMREYRLRA